MMEKGATTIWELWNGDSADPAMNSGNHVMLVGDLVIWLYEHLAGIKGDPAAPGFKRILMKPVPLRGLNEVRATHMSPHGLIESAWKSTAGVFEWTIRVPANAGAIVYVPARTSQDVKEGGKSLSQVSGVKFIRTEGSHVVCEVGSGTYHFASPMPDER
jgi:alpha-L-rhamnosidase